MITEPYELTISIPARHFTPEQIENIRTFVSRNDSLLRSGLPAVSTEIIVDDDHISFPWFVQTGPAVDQANFIANMCRKLRHVNVKSAPKFESFDEIAEWVLPTEEITKVLRKRYPAGTRIRLLEMADDPCPVPAGTEGTVMGVDSEASLLVEWDNGQSLNVIHQIDRVEIITPAPPFPVMAGQDKDSVDEHTD